MKFGDVQVAQAEGAILAHSIALPNRRMRKGHLLSQKDVDELTKAGLAELTVAQLEKGDVHEDAAAAALAAALVPDPEGQGIELTRPSTGRVNLLAKGAGVVALDVAALEAVNTVHPMITIATVPPFHQMAAGGMIATIKIISYAVAGETLGRACDLARRAIILHPPTCSDVRLIVTDIEGGAGAKGWRAIADRVAAFGLVLNQPEIVPHRIDDLAEALKSQDCDLTLILTGSATSDIDDVAPEALRRAGGTVSRFGMPVDPGNLLFLGTLQQKVVIGLPGCARAPALNGADWVMARVICGLAVTDADISAMGVGGLLKEIPSRPHPRRGRGTG